MTLSKVLRWNSRSGFAQKRWLARRWLYRLGLALLSLFTVLVIALPPNAVGLADAAIEIQMPLSAQGSQIIDATGKPVLLRGVNWFGMETDAQAPHGLWARDYKEMLWQIRSLGYNVIRLPYSVKALQGDSISAVDYSIGNNRDLEGKTPLEVMDLIVQEADRQGIFILLDSHRLNNERIPELWYGDGFTEEDWINTWTMLADRYRHQKNIIGADLKNEPHGRASWGTDDRETDWRLAAERAGNAISAVNPDWLIVVEGVEKNVPGQQLEGHWWGGNLEGVRRFPVRLDRPDKLVYSPHEYGPGVAAQPWFSESSFPMNLYRRWEIGFNYIAQQGIAPVLVGEFGGRSVDPKTPEGVWQQQFTSYLKRHDLSFAYWSWNPNSDDTGGLLTDDWQTIDQPKQAMLGALLGNLAFAPSSDNPMGQAPFRPSGPPSAISPVAPSPPSDAPVYDRPSPSGMEPAPSPSMEPAASQPAASQPGPNQSIASQPIADRSMTLRVDSMVQSDWQTGFCTSFKVSNPGSAPSGKWQLQFQMNQAEISQSWNGVFNRQGTQYIVEPPDWGITVQPGQTVDMGFCANKQGSDYQPNQIQITMR